jgi:hypothetical protein
MMKNVLIWGAFALLLVTMPIWYVPAVVYYARKGGWRRELEKEQMG